MFINSNVTISEFEGLDDRDFKFYTILERIRHVKYRLEWLEEALNKMYRHKEVSKGDFENLDRYSEILQQNVLNDEQMEYLKGDKNRLKEAFNKQLERMKIEY